MHGLRISPEEVTMKMADYLGGIFVPVERLAIVLKRYYLGLGLLLHDLNVAGGLSSQGEGSRCKWIMRSIDR